MKILMLTPYLPYPPSSGGQIRSFNLIKNLAKKHQITLFSLIKTEEEKKYISVLEEFCHQVEVFKRPENPWTVKNILRTALGLYPFLVVRNLSPEEKEAVLRKLEEEKFDLIHAETFYVMPHIPETKIPILLVDQTIEYQVYQHFAETAKFWFLRPLLYLDVAKLKFWESRFWQKAAKVVAVSEVDKEKMLSSVPKLSVEVVPNGAGEDLLSLWGEKKAKKEPLVFFQGNFLWLQNTEAARILALKIFPLVQEKIPEVSCLIAGQGAKEKIGDLATPKVEILDISTSDIEGVKKAYRRASIFLAPLFGPGGTRLKILGAMAAGVPVVTTQTGIEGIDAEDGEEVLIKDKPEEMAEATVRLFKDKKLYTKLTLVARELVEEKYNWEKIAEKLDRIYKEVSRAKKD